MDLMDLCTYKDAAEYIIYKGIFKDATSRSGYGSSGLSSWSSAGSSASDLSDFEGSGADQISLPLVTMSVSQLCKKLKMSNKKFKYEFVNECDDPEVCELDYHEPFAE